MDAISSIARASAASLVIEDAAHARGSTLDGAACGTLGDAGCFSFFPNKNMTTGEGGMVVFRDEDVAERARRLRSHAMTTMTWDRHRGHAASYDVVEVGFNYRIDELRAALGRVQLSRLDELNAARERRDWAVSRGAGLEREASAARYSAAAAAASHLAPVLAAVARGSGRMRERLRAGANPDEHPLPGDPPLRQLRDPSGACRTPRRSPTGC